uniref:SRCR domain-containing protein n=1 Tax=Sarcophilus harrisii TaxID=9305 RepID=A0A7N4NHU3_SARHA
MDTSYTCELISVPPHSPNVTSPPPFLNHFFDEIFYAKMTFSPVDLTHWFFLDLPVIRLVNGRNKCEGRLEVYHNETWGTVCDDLWSISAASVVCRQLDCGLALSAPRNSMFGKGSGSILLDDVQCDGNETNIGQCHHLGLFVHNCGHHEDAGVVCSECLLSEQGPTLGILQRMNVRLVNGRDRCEGLLEVYYNGTWGTVCDDLWDIHAAHVVCRQLDCGEGRSSMKNGYFGAGSGSILLDDVQCQGNENNLGQCRHRGFSVHNCGHHEDAGVICSGILCIWCIHLPEIASKTKIQFLFGCSFDGRAAHPSVILVNLPLRLVNGRNRCEGRIEVRYDGIWGTVCDDHWNIKNARVVCKLLGCGRAVGAPGHGRFGAGVGDILLDDVRCVGNEASLEQCHHSGWGVHNCKHQEDAGVICTGIPQGLGLQFTILPLHIKGTLRLVSNHSRCEGRVEIYHDGQWGMVCDDGWDLQDAQVVCRQLGCGGAISAPGNAYFGQGSGPISLYDVQCTGNEDNLRDCSHRDWLSHNCTHLNDAGVICSNIM